MPPAPVGVPVSHGRAARPLLQSVTRRRRCPDGPTGRSLRAAKRISTLDPNTGQFQRYRIPTEGGGPHSLWNDSKGNFWFTYFAAAGKIGRFDSKTQQVREYDFPGFSGYGLVVDKQDRAWAVGLNTPVVYGYDPSNDKWTTYKITSAARGWRSIQRE